MRYLLLMLCLSALPLLAAGQEETVQEALTDLEDQVDVAVTAYNNGTGLIRDTRHLELPTGELALEFQGVAEQIRPETVSLRSLADAGSVTIFEQNYEYDLISPSKLMEKYVGKTVRLVSFSEEDGFDSVDAVLMSYNEGPIYQVGDAIYLGHPGNVVLPEIPENLIAEPSLIWRLGNAQASQQLEVTYLTGGMSWQADYVVSIPNTEEALDLKGWVTLNNQSGATYTNARLKLVAGEVHMAPQPKEEGMMRREMAMAMMDAAAMPAEEAFAEFHLYTMPRRTTLKQNQSKQLALLDAAGVAFTKKYEFRAQEHWFFQQMPPQRDQHVQAFLEFENEQANQLGMPLPAGVMRIYQEDSEGTLQFAGEDRIQHTPKDETVKLQMGEAFDVVADRIQTEFRVIADNVYESAYEITIRNHKATDITVEVIEHLPGDWRIQEASMEHEKRDAQTAVFQVPVPADGETVVTYTVQVRH